MFAAAVTSVLPSAANATSLTTAGTYTEIFAGSGGCDSTVELTLAVAPAVDRTLTTAGPLLTSNQSGASYQWLDCDNGFALIPGETSISYTATVNGNYGVIIELAGCRDTSFCYDVIGLGFDPVPAKDLISLFPSPVATQLTIHSGINFKNGSVQLMNLSGMCLREIRLEEGKDIHIDCSELSPGMYFVKIIAVELNAMHRFVKK